MLVVKQLRSIGGSLKVEVAKKIQLEERIAKEHRKPEEFREYPGVYDDAMKEDITKRIDDLNDELVTKQETIDILNPIPHGVFWITHTWGGQILPAPL